MLEILALLVQGQPLVVQHQQHGLANAVWRVLLVQLVPLVQGQPLVALLRQHGLANAV